MRSVLIIPVLLALSLGRAAGGFTPTDLPGSVLWLDAADEATVSTSTDRGHRRVDQWKDKSSGGKGSVSGKAGHRPRHGTLKQNGHKLITLSGNQRHLDGKGVLAENDDTYTFFVVWRPTATDGAPRVVFEQAGPGTNARASLLTHNLHYGFNGESNDRADLAPCPPGAFRLTAMGVDNTLERDARNNLLLIDNGKRFPGRTGDPGALHVKTQAFRVGGKIQGGGEFFKGDIAEIIIYDRLLSDGSVNPDDNELNRVQVYLDRKWGLGLGIVPARESFRLTGADDQPITGVVVFKRDEILRVAGSRFRIRLKEGANKARGFTLESESTGKSYGPFAWRDGAKIRVGGLVTRLKIL